MFQKALGHGDACDEQIVASVDGDPKAIFLGLALRDVGTACDLFRPVWERTAAREGYVSIEVEPNLAADTAATIAQATHFHEAIVRPNLLVKIPATDAGVSAIEHMTAGAYGGGWPRRAQRTPVHRQRKAGVPAVQAIAQRGALEQASRARGDQAALSLGPRRRRRIRACRHAGRRRARRARDDLHDAR
jgi:hypothetical protein